ncbi:MAG TPA: hypothetical protein VNU26_17390 [Mycobacteriales bacterium]|nr:hypothetical protein [Mycobacteriales bacterium]
MRPSRAWLAGLLLGGALLLLTGCSVDVRDEIRGTVEDITLDANARDADAVRRGVAELLDLLDRAVREGEMTSAEAARIAEIAQRLAAGAQALEPEPSPSPTTTSPTPSPTTTSPTPEPTTESPTPEPTTEEPTPEPTTEEPTPDPTEPPVLPTAAPTSPQPSAQSSPATG